VKINPGELARSECSESGVLAKTLKTTKYVRELVLRARIWGRRNQLCEEADVN